MAVRSCPHSKRLAQARTVGIAGVLLGALDNNDSGLLNMENRQSENARIDAHYITVIACDRTRINRLPGEVRARKVRHIGKTRMSDRFSFF